MANRRNLIGVSDSRRDAQRYHRLLLALERATAELKTIGRENSPDIDEILGKLLPDLTLALNARQAFVALLRADDNPGHKWLELTSTFPNQDLNGQSLALSELFRQLIEDGEPKTIDPLEEETQDLIPGLEIFAATSAILTRMRIANQTYLVGVCNKGDPDLGPFLAADGMALDNLVELLSLGVRVGERRRRELESVQKTSAAISSQLDLEALLPTIVQGAAEIFGAPATSLMLWDDGQENLMIAANWGLSKGYAQQQRIAGNVLREISEASAEIGVLITPDLRLKPLGDVDLIMQEDLCTVLRAPLLVDDELIGLLNIYSRSEPRQYTRYESELARIFANQAAVAVKNARFYKDAQSQARQLQAVLTAGQNITALRPVQEVLQAITDSLVDNFGYDTVTLFPYQSASKTFDQPVISGHLHFPEIVLGKATSDTLVENRLSGPEFYFTSKSSSDELLAGQFTQRENIQASGYVRLTVGTEVVGILFVNYRKPHKFTSDEESAVRLFANQAAIAIHNLRQFEAVQNQLDKLEMTLAASQGIMAQKPLRERLQAMLDRLISVEGYDIAAVIPYHPVRGTFGQTLVAGQARDITKILGQYHKGMVSERRLTEGPDEHFTTDAPDDPLLSGPFVMRERIRAAASLRMKHGDQIVGLLFANKREPHPFTAQKQETLRLYANQAAVALHEASLFRRVRERMDMLIRIGQEVGQSLRLEKILNMLYAQLRDIFGADISPGVLLYDESRQELYAPYPEQFDMRADIARGGQQTTVKVGEGICGWVAELKQALNVPDVDDDPRYLRLLKSTRSELAVPILLGDRLVGVLDVESPKPGKFKEDDQRLLEAVASQVAAAIQNAEQYEHLEKNQQQLEALHRAAATIAKAGLEKEDVLETILEQAVKVTGATFGTIHLMQGNDLEFVSAWPSHRLVWLKSKFGKLALDGPGITVRAARLNDAQLVPDVAQDKDFVDATGKTGSELAVVLRREGQPIGVLNVEHQELGGLDHGDRNLLIDLANLAVVTLQNAEQAEQLSRTNAIALMGAWGADIVHDVNREVGAIRRAVFSLLEQSNLPPDVSESLQEIDSYAEKLALPELPEQAPASGEELELRNAAILDEVIRAEVSELEKSHSSTTLRLELNCKGITIAIQEPWLRRLLRHLVKNAIRTTPEEEGPLEVTVRTIAQDPIRMAKVFVIDTGPGVRPEIEPLLFRRPVPHAASRKALRAGRGLLLVRHVVEMYGGEAWLEWNRPGEGACFAFSVPLANEQ